MNKNNINIDEKFNTDLLLKIAAEYGSPTYVYNKSLFLDNYQNYNHSFSKYTQEDYMICYAVKANSNLSILKELAKQGAGFDIVSLGELKRVLAAGGNPNRVVFSGVGKQDFEIKEALETGIYCFNVESEPELMLINQIAGALKTTASISIRVNPNINAKSHPYISTGLKEHKFGIAIEYAENIFNLAKDLNHISIKGIDCHIGSQLTELEPLKETCLAINKLVSKLAENDINISHLNFGGGLGINYERLNNNMPTPADWVKTITENTLPNKKILIEPGRSIIGNAGLLLTKVIYNKIDSVHHHHFTIVDAAMNDLLRPALYSAEHKIINLTNAANNTKNTSDFITSVVGPVCESSDVFLKNINLQSKPGDILAILDSGAYGFVMSSNYNSRPRAAEVMLDNNNYTLIRPRETYQDLYQDEIIF